MQHKIFREQFTTLRNQVISHMMSLYPKAEYADSEYVMLVFNEPITADALVADVSAIILKNGKLALIDDNDTENPMEDINDLDVLISVIEIMEKRLYVHTE